MRRIRVGSGSLVSNTAVSLADIELSQRGADGGLGPPARLAISPSYPRKKQSLGHAATGVIWTA